MGRLGSVGEGGEKGKMVGLTPLFFRLEEKKGGRGGKRKERKKKGGNPPIERFRAASDGEKGGKREGER